MKTVYDHVVIGAGVIGTATAYWLARCAQNVLVVEQFDLGHDRGASEDHSRIIRHVYHNTTYTALTPAMYEHWSELEAETGLQLVLKTGGLDFAIAGTAGEAELGNYRASLAPINVEHEDLTADDIRRRWPQWHIGDDTIGMYQADSGILDVRRACAAQIARARGVEFAPNTTVTALASTEDRVTLTTDRGGRLLVDFPRGDPLAVQAEGQIGVFFDALGDREFGGIGAVAFQGPREACRPGGALALRPVDLDPDQCLIRLREKGETVRWQPVSRTLMAYLQQHAAPRRRRTYRQQQQRQHHRYLRPRQPPRDRHRADRAHQRTSPDGRRQSCEVDDHRLTKS